MRVQRNPTNWVDSEETSLLTHHYQLCDVLEKSPICTVYRANHRNTSKAVAIKSLNLGRYIAATGLTAEAVEKEVEICATLKHPFFCQLRDVISGSNALHLIFEYVEGGDICFEIVKRASSGFIYSEAVASHYIRQLCEALVYLKDQNIVHLDIRPHNILLASRDNNASLKVRGFGIARQLSGPNDRCSPGRIGVPQFIAPEIVDGREYAYEADCWSMGVLLCLLLSGRLPFNGSIEAVYERIKMADYSLELGSWTKISEPAKDLVSQLLVVNVERRLTARECLQHAFLANKSVPQRAHLSETVESIRRYNQRRKLKSNIVAAVNNPRWNRFPVHSFLSSDSVSGGDACDADCVKRGPLHNTNGADIEGVEKILSVLDKMNIFTDLSVGRCTSFEKNQLEEALNDPVLRDIMSLYDRIRNNDVRPSKLNQNAMQYLAEVKNEIDGLLSPSAEARELVTLLNNPHIQAIMQSQNIAVEEVFGPNTVDFVQSPQEATYLQQDCVAQNEHIATQVSNQTGKPMTPFATANGHLVQMTADMSLVGQPSDQRQFPPSSSTSSMSIHRSYAIDSNTPGPSHRPEPAPVLFEDDDDDLILNSVSRVRLVQFQKETEEPMGITLKITEDGRCLVARIMHGGLIHRQGTLHVFDEISEINGISVTNQSVEVLQHMLRNARGHVTFKIVPSYRSAPPVCEIYVRAQFDYDPAQDDLIPCSDAGVPFKTGDILQVISKDDHSYWQARFVQSFPALGNAHQSQMSNSISGALPNNHNHAGDQSTSNTLPNRISTANSSVVAGLIPSPELQEWRTACLAVERTKDNQACTWFNRRKKFTTKYLRKHSNMFEQLDLVTYEEVVRLSSFRRKTLVLLGAHGVGRRHIKNTLIHRHTNRFAYPIPHTTRPPRKDEIDGKHYFFVSNDTMLADIQANEYLEYGTHEECMYGTKLETIRVIHRTGKMALKILRTAEYAPFVVFIGAPDLQGLQDPDGSLEKLVKESECLRQAFGHLFDYVICNNDIDDTIKQLEVIVEKLGALATWLPVSWVY